MGLLRWKLFLANSLGWLRQGLGGCARVRPCVRGLGGCASGKAAPGSDLVFGVRAGRWWLRRGQTLCSVFTGERFKGAEVALLPATDQAAACSHGRWGAKEIDHYRMSLNPNCYEVSEPELLRFGFFPASPEGE